MKPMARLIAALAWGVWGCGSIEQQTTRTSPADCQTYCGLAFLHCKHGNTLYTQFADCMDACSAFPTTGESGDISGDSLQCRLTFVIVAERDPMAFCRNASVAGGPACQ